MFFLTVVLLYSLNYNDKFTEAKGDNHLRDAKNYGNIAKIINLVNRLAGDGVEDVNVRENGKDVTDDADHKNFDYEVQNNQNFASMINLFPNSNNAEKSIKNLTPDVNIFYIENPHVLEEYKKKLKGSQPKLGSEEVNLSKLISYISRRFRQNPSNDNTKKSEVYQSANKNNNIETVSDKYFNKETENSKKDYDYKYDKNDNIVYTNKKERENFKETNSNENWKKNKSYDDYSSKNGNKIIRQHDDSNEKSKKYNWKDEDTKDDYTTKMKSYWKDTPRNPKENNNWKSYDKPYESYQPIKSRYDYDDRNKPIKRYQEDYKSNKKSRYNSNTKGFGRTPPAIVGKPGIYEE